MLTLATIEHETLNAQKAKELAFKEHEKKPTDATLAYCRTCSRHLARWRVALKLYTEEREVMLARAVEDIKKLTPHRAESINRLSDGGARAIDPFTWTMSNLVKVVDLEDSFYVKPMQSTVQAWLVENAPEGSIIRRSNVDGIGFVIPLSVANGLLETLLDAFDGKKS